MPEQAPPIRMAGSSKPMRAVRRLADRHGATIALVGYALLSVLLFGLRVLAHPGRTYVGGYTTDPQVLIWSLAWWPHALLHGQNPFVTKELWAPVGINLAWSQTAPGLAILLAPLTLVAGPIVAYNTAALAMPALGAWASFLLCRHLTRATGPAIVGGYLFGFSTYVIGGTLAHVQTTAVFVVPLVALTVVRFFEGELAGRGLALRLAALLTAQALIETEILFTLTLALVVGLVLVAVLVPPWRTRLPPLAGPLVAAYTTAGVLLSPLLYYLAAGSSAAKAQSYAAFVGDAMNVVVPTHVEAIGWWADHLTRAFPANDAERGTYIGVPVLVIVALFARTQWRSRAGRLLLVAFLLGLVATLGSWLTLDGHRLIELPWVHLASRPPFSDLMPVRFSLYTSLVTALVVALWLTRSRADVGIRIGLSVLAIVSLAPNVGLADWAGPQARTLFAATPPTIPALFSGNGYRSCLRKNEVVLALPFGSRGNSLIWQAEAGFWFRLAGGYIANAVPPFFATSHAVEVVASNKDPALVTLAELRAFLRAASVSTIVLDAAQSEPWRTLLGALGQPQLVGGAFIYRLGASRSQTTSPGSCARQP